MGVKYLVCVGRVEYVGVRMGGGEKSDQCGDHCVVVGRRAGEREEKRGRSGGHSPSGVPQTQSFPCSFSWSESLRWGPPPGTKCPPPPPPCSTLTFHTTLYCPSLPAQRQLERGVAWPTPGTTFWELPTRATAMPVDVGAGKSSMVQPRDSRSLDIVHFTAELAPIAKVGGGD